MKPLIVVFLSVLVAELGDKTQLATLLFATEKSLSRVGVFVAASAALVFSSLIAVLLGAQIERVAPRGDIEGRGRRRIYRDRALDAYRRALLRG